MEPLRYIHRPDFHPFRLQLTLGWTCQTIHRFTEQFLWIDVSVAEKSCLSSISDCLPSFDKEDLDKELDVRCKGNSNSNRNNCVEDEQWMSATTLISVSKCCWRSVSGWSKSSIAEIRTQDAWFKVKSDNHFTTSDFFSLLESGKIIGYISWFELNALWLSFVLFCVRSQDWPPH